jgi:hypothetical protein
MPFWKSVSRSEKPLKVGKRACLARSARARLSRASASARRSSRRYSSPGRSLRLGLNFRPAATLR